MPKTARERTRSTRKTARKAGKVARFLFVFALVVVAVAGGFMALGFSGLFDARYEMAEVGQAAPVRPALDKAAYDAKLLQVANLSTSTLAALIKAAGTTSPSVLVASSTGPWPAKAPYPLGGALLPFNRIVAYYGNFYSKSMGVLGEYPTDQMLSMLQGEVEKWSAADPATPVIPAIDYIAVTAQGSPGADGKYRLRMPDEEIEKAISLAKEVDGIVILDVQVGLSDLQTELPLLATYLKLPQVHLAIDPEFAMATSGKAPGKVIGTFDASDVNYAAGLLASLVKEYDLPPKILVIHRFTEEMLTHYKEIAPLPEVEIVMDMDGWGTQKKKLGTYQAVVASEPVEFTGMKLFYKNDLRAPSTGMFSPDQVLKLSPQPLFIQYQ